MNVEDTSCSFPLLSRRRNLSSFSLLTIVNISPLSQVVEPEKMVKMTKEKLVHCTHTNQTSNIYHFLALKDAVYLCI